MNQKVQRSLQLFVSIKVVRHESLPWNFVPRAVPGHWTCNTPTSLSPTAKSAGFMGSSLSVNTPIWEFPKIRVPYLGALLIRILLFRVLY